MTNSHSTALITLPNRNMDEKELQECFDKQKTAFRAQPMLSCKDRVEVLLQLKRVLLNHQQQIETAIWEDFSGRSRDETILAEILPIVQNIRYVCSKLKKWMKPSKRSVGLHLQPAKAVVHYQPVGVVGVIAPWNYPLQLAVLPMVSALAAGNRVMVKMSEFTPRLAALFTRLMATHFPADLITVVQGDVSVATTFSKLPFDHLLFTGSTAVGRMVMRAAAENLTPVTLELGGKSPAIISSDINMDEAAERICFGKSFNGGQTCVAPDYVLCPRSKVDEFIASYQRAFLHMYPQLTNNGDYTCIINDRMQQRLRELVIEAQAGGAQVLVLGEQEVDDRSRRMPLHILTDVTDDMAVMQEEIFGPILPVVAYDAIGDAIDYINNRPRPLALYLFSHHRETQQLVLEQTRSGGVCINDTLLHVAVDDMPFGGIGDSGMGHYHGHEGFLTFSKARSTLVKGKMNAAKLLVPPYNGKLSKLIYKLWIH